MNYLELLNNEANKQKLAQLIQIDPHVDKTTKDHYLSFLTGPHQFDHLFMGAVGALVAANLVRFLNLQKETQILLSLAGFGAGVIISTHLANIPQPGVLKEHGTTHINLPH
jgi:hypothetical protein